MIKRLSRRLGIKKQHESNFRTSSFADPSSNFSNSNRIVLSNNNNSLMNNNNNGGKNSTYLEKHIKQRRQLIFMLMCVLFTFYICLFPLKIWNMTVMLHSFLIPNLFRILSFQTYWFINITVRIFFYLNSSMNPILYNFLSKKFRDSFKRLAVFRPCVASVNKVERFNASKRNRKPRTQENNKNLIDSNFPIIE